MSRSSSSMESQMEGRGFKSCGRLLLAKEIRSSRWPSDASIRRRDKVRMVWPLLGGTGRTVATYKICIQGVPDQFTAILEAYSFEPGRFSAHWATQVYQQDNFGRERGLNHDRHPAYTLKCL